MRKDVVVSRDVRFDEGVPGSQMATVIEEPIIIHNSIMVLPGSRPMEHLESDKENSISDDEEPETEQQILQQFTARELEQ